MSGVRSSRLRVGDWVEVRSKEEILRTLDRNARLDGLPFTPQMLQYCGRRFRVYKSAHKTCDTVNPIRGRRVADAVHLELRCDGAAYGGCQAACLLFWKTAWLKPVGTSDDPARPAQAGSCTEAAVFASTVADGSSAPDGPKYVCQATQLPEFTSTLKWWNVRQYIDDYTSGNVTLGQLSRGLIFASYASVLQAGIGVGPALRWFYDLVQRFRGGVPYPRRSGRIPAGEQTPLSTLDLQPGELVRVRTHREILATLDTRNCNRGLMFDREMVPYCGGVYVVKTRLQRFIDEKTGKLCSLKNAAVILEDVTCRARYSDCRMFCPRSIYPWWRETWLERVFRPVDETSEMPAQWRMRSP